MKTSMNELCTMTFSVIGKVHTKFHQNKNKTKIKNKSKKLNPLKMRCFKNQSHFQKSNNQNPNFLLDSNPMHLK